MTFGQFHHDNLKIPGHRQSAHGALCGPVRLIDPLGTGMSLET
jgi:hypothetical protein